MITEVIGKTKMIHNNLLEKLIVNTKNIFDRKEVVNEFKTFFIKIGPKLAEKMQQSNYSSGIFTDTINTYLLEQTVSINELNPTKVRELMT